MLKRSLATEFTAEQYLALEDVSDTKHEFYDGKIYDMAGGTPDHNLVSANMITALNNALAQTPCRVFDSDMRILIEDEELYTHPDVSVVCGKMQFDPKSKSTLTNPIVLVEAMSPSTRAYDRGAKFKFYKKIPSLQELVLVESERAHVEVLRRIPRGQWTIEIYNDLDAVAVLKTIEGEISLRQIYAKVTWLD
ncbi:MAG: Uma2 family endonuclease [Chloroflexi bacterium]|nr:Uma2 family endonuclease [Chloroflexota bacterium]